MACHLEGDILLLQLLLQRWRWLPTDPHRNAHSNSRGGMSGSICSSRNTTRRWDDDITVITCVMKSSKETSTIAYKSSVIIIRFRNSPRLMFFHPLRPTPSRHWDFETKRTTSPLASGKHFQCASVQLYNRFADEQTKSTPTTYYSIGQHVVCLREC